MFWGKIPGFKTLIEKSPHSKSSFRRSASKIYEYGINQSKPCVYYVKVIRKGLGISDLEFIEQFFYKDLVDN